MAADILVNRYAQSRVHAGRGGVDQEVLGLYRVELDQRAVGLTHAYCLHSAVHNGLCAGGVYLLLFDGDLCDPCAVYCGVDEHLCHAGSYACVVEVFV